MSIDPLRGSKLKIEWANKRIDEIDAICRHLFTGDHYTIVKERDTESSDYMVKVKLTLPIPDDVYMLIAETAYHLRSSLDQVIVAIARATGIANTRNIYFPLRKTRADFATTLKEGKKIKLLPADVIDLIRQIEPFEGGRHSLWGLGPLSNIDKHDSLVPLGQVGFVRRVRGVYITGGITEFFNPVTGRLDNGIVISHLGPEGEFGLAVDDRENLNVTGDIVFGEIEAFQGEPIIPTLHKLAEHVAGVVQIFDAHFFGQQGAHRDG